MKIVTLDFETTGTDTKSDRIITSFIRARDGDNIVFEQSMVIDPGVEVPEKAAEVHGMTTEWVREHGRKDVEQAIGEISDGLWKYGYEEGYVVCGYNSSFDLAILDSEVQRHIPDWETLPIKGAAVRYIDPVIFSRVFDKYVKGGHQLITVAKRNGIEIEEDRLHAADYDVEVTEKLVPIMLNRAWQELKYLRQGLTPDEFVTKLQKWQADEKRRWADNLTAYKEQQGQRNEDGSKIIVEGDFPW